MKKAYLFRGAPASGKGSISERFLEHLNTKSAYLELDLFRWSFHLTTRKIKDVADEEHAFAYQNFLTLLESYCENGKYDLVVEGLFSWDEPGAHGNTQDIITLFKKYAFDYKLFFLYADREALWQRNLEREYSVPENEFEELYKNVMKKIGDDEIQIDTTNKNIEETMGLIISNL